MNAWTLEQREHAQNQHCRQDRLCMELKKHFVQATRTEPMKRLPDMWLGHSCIGDLIFKDLESARIFAREMGYDGIYL